ncbi:MAG: hypothetical protein LBS09_02980 [Bacteroidales bacterium]|jgi:hypothetical protein|nr:hypothetical protein [Bacteroidales bacterium]
MKPAFNLLFLLCVTQYGVSQTTAYRSLDASNPIVFMGDHIEYKGGKIVLDEKNFFVDGQLSDADVARSPYVFRSVQEAVKHLSDGTEARPMMLYLAPWVYWIDDPDDPDVRKPAAGGRAPFGMEIKCEWLRFYGLTDKPENVVLACNRGQTQGSDGNFTMFYIEGNGTSTENVTLGNYCNVDLVFPLLPRLNRAKRSNTVTQAQLAICNGDRITARNTRFVSRLNLCPFSGGKRVFFDRCHFECTDDALCGTGVYLNCDLDFYSSKPFAATQGTGAVFLNCDIEIITDGAQYLTKRESPVAIVDSRFRHASGTPYIGWTQYPKGDLMCYQYQVSLNGKPVVISPDVPQITVDMSGKAILNAYRFEYGGQVVYNTYNLLKGDDDWDPANIKALVAAAEKELGKKLTDIPTYLRISPASARIESGVTSATLSVTDKRAGFYDVKTDDERNEVTYEIAREYRSALSLDTNRGQTCTATGINNSDQTVEVTVTAYTPSGLRAASVLTVAPKFLDAPRFLSLPKILPARNGRLTVAYELALEGRKDESLITWYRCRDAKGSQPVEVAVSRLNRPEQTYELTPGDAGCYMMISVAPKHLRCHAGKAETFIMTEPVAAKDVSSGDFYTDFQNFPTAYQPLILPGYWTVDGYKPKDTEEHQWTPSPTDSWFYGTGINGAVGTGLLQAKRGARLLYTPVDGKYGDMKVTLNVDPCKTAGQGFGSATGQYLDVYIKMDTKTLTGYGMRIIRTVKYDHAVDFILMRYENGTSRAISPPVSSTCFRTGCTITLNISSGRLTAHAETVTPTETPAGLHKTVDLSAEVIPDAFGGTGIQHTGTTGDNATMLHWLKIETKTL